MGQLEDMALFVRIIEAGGIGKAAEQLNIAKSAVSKRLSDLEAKLGTQLLSRTTRKSTLTDAGTTYYQRSLTIIDDVDEMNAQTLGSKTSLSGTLKMTMPLSFGLLHLTPVINEFTKKHPDLNLQIDFVDRHIDLIEEGYELAIRIADLKDSSLQAKRLMPIHHILCASPDYLEKAGIPKNITELAKHNFLQYGSNNVITVGDPQGKAHKLQLNSKIAANNGDFLKDMAINGHGIGFAPTFIVHQAITSGQLIPIMAEYKLPLLHAYAVYPQTRFLSQRCRVLIDFIANYFGEQPYWDEF